MFCCRTPVAPIVLTNPAMLPDGTFEFGFTHIPGMRFTANNTINMGQPFSNWTRPGGVTEVAPGQFQFTNTTASGDPARFYRVTSP